MTRVKDPELMRELHDVWTEETGCAICSYMPSPEAGPGWALELHHVQPRSQGGPDAAWNIIALCGGLTENRCHQRVTEHVYEVQRNEQGFLVWRDRRAGGQLWAPVRFTPKYSQLPPESPAGATDVSNGEAPPTTFEPAATPDDSTAPPSGSSSDYPPQGHHTPETVALESAVSGAPSPDDPPEVRAAQIRERVTTTKRLLMEAAILLRYAYERDDHAALGVSWVDYYGSLGLESSNVSKMLAAARVLGDEWQGLTASAREHVSVEQLYQASLLVTRNEWSPASAIDAAVSNPTSRLIALRIGDEPAEKCRCVCPECQRELFHDRGGV